VFGLFKSPPFDDSQLGQLIRSRGLWRGTLEGEPSMSVPLAIAGPRSGPDPQALEAARQIAPSYPEWKPVIAAALFEHLEPYAQDVGDGKLAAPEGGLPGINTPNDVWPHVTLVFASVTPLGGVLTTELGYTTAWDEEHTLGARFQSGEFLELCGSVLAP
jgi:hypothetical protein